MAATLEFYFDFISPYTFLASTQIEALAERTGAKLIYRPVFLGGIFKETGNQPPVNIPKKAQYLPKDVQDWANHYGITMTFPPTFPFNSVKAVRGAIVAEREGKLPEYTQAAFRACWAEGKDISNVEVIADVAAGVGLDREKFLAAIEDPDVKEDLKRRTAESVEKGAFGLPMFLVDGEMFWGNDRLILVEERLRKAG
jgi:2-hydroxychromene-2-carboxylate isomerase